MIIFDQIQVKGKVGNLCFLINWSIYFLSKYFETGFHILSPNEPSKSWGIWNISMLLETFLPGAENTDVGVGPFLVLIPCNKSVH